MFVIVYNYSCTYTNLAIVNIIIKIYIAWLSHALDLDRYPWTLKFYRLNLKRLDGSSLIKQI